MSEKFSPCFQKRNRFSLLQQNERMNKKNQRQLGEFFGSDLQGRLEEVLLRLRPIFTNRAPKPRCRDDKFEVLRSNSSRFKPSVIRPNVLKHDEEPDVKC